MLFQGAHPFQAGQSIRRGLAGAELHGDIALVLPLLPGLQQGLVIQHQAAAADLLHPLLLRLVVLRGPAEGDHGVPGRDIHHPRGDDLMAVALLPVGLQGEKVQQHLQAHAVPHVGQAELLPAGFVVHHPEIQLALMEPAVHPVGNAGELQAPLPFPQFDGGKVPGLGEVQLKVQGLKVRAAQLRRHVLHHLVHIVFQALEQIGEAAGLLLEIIQLLLDEAVNILIAELPQLLLADLPEATQSLYLPGGVLQHVVHEVADLRRAEAGRLMGLGLQAVLAEIGELAGGEFVNSGGAEPQPLAVKLLHHPGGQTPPAQLGRRSQSGHPLRLLPAEVVSRRLGRSAGTFHPLGGQTQGRAGGCHPQPGRIGKQNFFLEKGLSPVKDKGGAQLRPISIHHGTAHGQAVAGQAQAVVDQGKFPPQLAVAPWAQIQLQLQQPLPLLLGEDPALLLGLGQALVGAAQHDQVLQAAAAVPVKVAGTDPVQRDGDGADVVLREHQQKQLAKLRHVHGAVPQDGGKLLQSRHTQLPQLPVLRRQFFPAALLQLLGAALQGLRQVQLLQQLGKGQGLGFGGVRLPGALVIGQQGAAQGLAAVIDAVKLFLRRLIVFHAVALGVLPPFPVPLPGGGTQLPLEDIVLQLITGGPVKAGEAGAQIADHIIHCPAGLVNVKHAAHQCSDGLGQQVTASRCVQRDAVVAEDALQAAPVVLKAPGQDGDIPPAAALIPHQGQGPGRRQLALGNYALAAVQVQRATLVREAAVRIAEHIFRKKAERRGLAAFAFQQLHPGLHAQLLRRLQQRPAGPAGQGIDLVVTVHAVHRQADGELHLLPQQGQKHLLLLPGEVDEAVHIHMGALIQIAFCDLSGQHRQPVCRVGMAVGHYGVIGLQHQGQILQLVPQAAAAFPGGGQQGLGADGSGLQLIHRREQHGLQFRPSLRHGVDLQPGAQLLQGQSHAQQPPTLVQIGRAAAAQLAGHAPGKAGEAEHLGIQRQSVPAAAAKLPLRLMAVLLRHQHNPAGLPGIHGLLDFIYHGGGLAGARFAGHQCQQFASLLVWDFSFLLFYQTPHPMARAAKRNKSAGAG